MTAVEVSELVKRYPKSPVNAVDGISFAVEPGEVFGLLGPERRRQDDHGRDADDAGQAHRRPGDGRRRRRRRGPGARAEHARGGPAAQQPRPLALDPPEPDLPRRLPRRSGGRGGRAGRRAARAVRAARARQRQARPVLGRAGAARDDRAGADAPAAGAVPRRADDRASIRRRGCSSGTGCASCASAA